MSFLQVIEKIGEELKRSTKELGYEQIEPEVSEPTVKVHGDISSRVCFDISKISKENPVAIAEKISSRIKLDFSEVEAKNGYINFKFNDKYIFDVIEEIRKKGHQYGIPAIENKNKKIIIEHTNSNPNKPIHMGILRNTILGDTLARVFRYVGYETIVLNYIDDSGAQVSDNILAITELGYLKEPIGERYDYYSGRIYAEVHEKIENDLQLRKKKYEIIKKIENGKNEVAQLARQFSERVVMDQLRTCWRVGAFFDLLNWESDIVKSGLLNVVLKELNEKGKLYVPKEGKNEKCTVLKLSDQEEFKNLEEPDEVLIRSDGTITYVGKDIAYAFWKISKPPIDFKYRPFVTQPNGKTLWTTDEEKGEPKTLNVNNADLAITLVDTRQEYPQKVVKTALTFITDKAKYAYRPFLYGIVAISGETAYKISGKKEYVSNKIVHMSGRKGLVVNAEDMLNELAKVARMESRKRNPNIREDLLESISNEIAVAAVRYFMLKTDLNNIIVFDIDEALRLNGDSGPRLQYTYARAYSIIEKAGKYDRGSINQKLIEKEIERELIKEISKFSFYVKETIKDLEPKYLARYAKNLADKFNLFYESCPILTEKEEIRNNRLIILESFLVVFEKVLDLLGIPVLQEM
ncbi:MAG: arginine--tRNA ligase [Thermoproteota archaeon]